MEGIKNQAFQIKRITEGPEHNFFGYYDLKTWDSSGRYHLCNKVKFKDRLPRKEDIATLGVIDTKDNTFLTIADTALWNFQQGAMLQWKPGTIEKEAIFNKFIEGEYRGIIKNIDTGKEVILERPIANVSPLGNLALSINFDRMFDFRPGYGYHLMKDKFANENAPEEDGIFSVDMITGKSKLIISLHQIYNLLKNKGSDISFGKLIVNHINFNTDGSRFVFLVRNFPQGGKSWGTAVCTANADGSDLFLLSDYTYASHYYWKDNEQLLIHARHKFGDQLYLMKDKTEEVEVVDKEYFLKDGHCSYSPDRNLILYDSYPDKENYRHLYLYDTIKRKGITLASLYSPPPSNVDIRCDLHPRWHPSGNMISFDSTHKGHRHIYIMNL